MTRHQSPTWALLTLLVALFACKTKSEGTLSNPQIGTLERGPGGLAIKAPVTRLPRVAADKGDIEHSFGICFDYAKGDQLGKVEVVVRPPAPIKTLRLGSGHKATPTEIRLPAPALRGSGHFCQDMYFDADDPLGTWGFDLARDGKAVKSWQLEVYEP